MTRKPGPFSSRNKVERRLFRALAFVIASLSGGALLGMIVIGEGLDSEVRDAAPFAGLSANPDALVTETAGAPVGCPDCADSYGVAVRLRAERDARMSEPFRRLGEVDVDMSSPPEPDDGYRYGGRLPDPEPRIDPARRDLPAMVLPVALPASPRAAPPIPIDAPRAPQQKDPGEAPEPLANPKAA